MGKSPYFNMIKILLNNSMVLFPELYFTYYILYHINNIFNRITIFIIFYSSFK